MKKQRTVIRTFHIDEELDEKMDAEVFHKQRAVTKTKIVNDALRAYFARVDESASSRKVK